MMDIESMVWLGSVGLLLLAGTGALVCVALLRRPCRRLFGAENAFLLWGLPPLAMLASQLPHSAVASTGMLSGAAWVVISGGAVLPRGQAGGFDWSGVLAGAWILGIAASLARAGGAQLRYRARLHGAVALPGASLRWPVLRARDMNTGPALVGAWRPRIVVPADFAVRYANAEQALILAHEAMHARRQDGWWNLLAQVLASLFWFHPLAWWALPALRHDQELACDAAVLRERRGCCRSYAQAMLKTPAAGQVLPVGCSWSSRHPLTERIAMLNSPSPGPFRRYLGVLASVALSTALTGVVYAASTPTADTGLRMASGDRQYQLDIQLALTREDARESHAQRLKVALCMRPGQSARLETNGIALGAITRPLPNQRVSIDLAVSEKVGATPVRSHLVGALRQPLQASGKVPGGNELYTVQITPQLGCPAAAVAATKGIHTPITMKVKGAAARQVVGWIATTAGFVLVNPEAIDQRQVTLDFQHVPAMSAMQMVADQDGFRAMFDGSRVRFEPKS